MPHAKANGLDIYYESHGQATDAPILLIMGLGAQMSRWSPDLIDKLIAAGHRVIAFDNRDVGLSEKLDAAGAPDMGARSSQALRDGGKPPVAYTLDEMAADAAGLLDALGIERAHIVGASMGGMIAQLVAADYPERTLSLTSIMSSTGNPDLPRATPEAMARLNTPGARSRPRTWTASSPIAVEGAKVMAAGLSGGRDGAARPRAERLPPLLLPGRVPAPVRGDHGLARPPPEAADDHRADRGDPRRRRSAGAVGRRPRHRREHPRRRTAHHSRRRPRDAGGDAAGLHRRRPRRRRAIDRFRLGAYLGQGLLTAP